MTMIIMLGHCIVYYCYYFRVMFCVRNLTFVRMNLVLRWNICMAGTDKG